MSKEKFEAIREFAESALLHIGDIGSYKHQTKHAEHFVKNIIAICDGGISVLTPAPPPQGTDEERLANWLLRHIHIHTLSNGCVSVDETKNIIRETIYMTFEAARSDERRRCIAIVASHRGNEKKSRLIEKLEGKSR